MKCPVLETPILGDKCPVTRCMYKSRDDAKQCMFASIAFEDGLTVEHLAEVFEEQPDDIAKQVEAGKRRIKVACVVDAYISTLPDVHVTVNSREAKEAKTPSVLRIFGLTTSDLYKVLDRSRYNQWRDRSGVDVSYADIEALLTLK